MLGILVFGGMAILISRTYDLVGNWILSLLPWDLDWVGSVSNWAALIGSSAVFLMIFRYIMLVFLHHL